MPYYNINEEAARRAKNAISYNDYVSGSATSEYRQMIDEATEIAEQQKKRVDPMYHEKIDYLLDLYARKLAANMNAGYEITARVPSILISGGGNFPVGKKAKQVAAMDKNEQEWRHIQGLLDKIRSTGMGGISSDDPTAIEKLKDKLANLEKTQETMKAVNAYYRKHQTFDGCPDISPREAEAIKANWEKLWYKGIPYPPYMLSNNNANIHRIRERIASLEEQQQSPQEGWDFEGGEVVFNTEENRLQILYEDKPDEQTRQTLKGYGFHWSPRQRAWQRKITPDAVRVARKITGKENI